jgi:hypothetical protein
VKPIVLGVAISSIIITVVAAGARGGAPQPGPTPAPVSRGVLLDPANRPDVYDKLPPGKRAALDRENQLRNQALEHPLAGRKPGAGSTDGRLAPTTPQIGPEHREAGAGMLIHGACGELFRNDNLDTNRWVEKLSDRSFLVCAGSDRNDPSQGTLFITAWSLNGKGQLPGKQPLPAGWFPTPSRLGTVTIVDAVGEVLTLKAKDGALFYFDVGASKYVDGPPRPAPAKTPSP